MSVQLLDLTFSAEKYIIIISDIFVRKHTLYHKIRQILFKFTPWMLSSDIAKNKIKLILYLWSVFLVRFSHLGVAEIKNKGEQYMGADNLRGEVKQILDKDEKFRKLLFPKGFLLTSSKDDKCGEFPFYSDWTAKEFCGYRFYIHPNQNVYLSSESSVGMALIGHAYNPVSDQEFSEQRILEKAIKYYVQDKGLFTEYFNEWTGSFALFIFQKSSVSIYGDPAGMYTLYYGEHEGEFYCSSHTNLIGEICNLSFDPYVVRLINYRFYSLFGKALPGDLSPYRGFKRVIPNHYVDYHNHQFLTTRFFPTTTDGLLNLPFDEIVKSSGDILASSMRLIHKKWERCAISLTGGCDSKTTLSCTNGQYDRYSYFSYASSAEEMVDAKAAADICKLMGLKHHLYPISDCDEDYHHIATVGKLMEYNSGSIGKDNPNDVRKRHFFIDCDDFDVEVKSWVSEVARAYYHKRFAKSKFPKKLTARYATNLYKVFLTDRKLIRDTDAIFNDFLKKYYSEKDFALIPWYDLFFWEFRMSSWNGLVITGEHQIAGDITIPYNNRRLLQLMLSAPLEYRINDQLHKSIMKEQNQMIHDCNISVVNVKHTQMRAKMERLYIDVFPKIRF